MSAVFDARAAGYRPPASRKRAVRFLAKAGFTNRQIADRLRCTLRTVRRHLADGARA